MQVIDGWLDAAKRCESPNYNERPEQAKVSLLVIHNISLPAGEFGTGCVEQLFTNTLDCHADERLLDLDGVQVSSHLLIDREGQLTQFVSMKDRAWHAGESCFEGQENCNDFSIGIELEGVDDSPYTEQQYQSLVRVTLCLMNDYPALTVDRIVGHSDIAPGRKTDPGPAFDWSYYRQQLVAVV